MVLEGVTPRVSEILICPRCAEILWVPVPETLPVLSARQFAELSPAGRETLLAALEQRKSPPPAPVEPAAEPQGNTPVELDPATQP